MACLYQPCAMRGRSLKHPDEWADIIAHLPETKTKKVEFLDPRDETQTEEGILVLTRAMLGDCSIHRAEMLVADLKNKTGKVAKKSGDRKGQKNSVSPAEKINNRGYRYQKDEPGEKAERLGEESKLLPYLLGYAFDAREDAKNSSDEEGSSLGKGVEDRVVRSHEQGKYLMRHVSEGVEPDLQSLEGEGEHFTKLSTISEEVSRKNPQSVSSNKKFFLSQG